MSSTQNKRIYKPGTFRARSRTTPLKRRTETDAAYAASRARFKNIDRDYIRLLKAVFHDYTKEVLSQIIQGTSFRIPMRLGTLLIVRYKAYRRIDWHHSRIYGKTIYHSNLELNGDSVKFRWSKQNGQALFANMTFFKFLPTRSAKRLLNRTIKTQFIDYAIYTFKKYFR